MKEKQQNVRGAATARAPILTQTTVKKIRTPKKEKEGQNITRIKTKIAVMDGGGSGGRSCCRGPKWP